MQAWGHDPLRGACVCQVAAPDQAGQPRARGRHMALPVVSVHAPTAGNPTCCMLLYRGPIGRPGNVSAVHPMDIAKGKGGKGGQRVRSADERESGGWIAHSYCSGARARKGHA